MSEPTVISGSATMTFSRYDDVTAALADPALVPLPAAPVAPGGPAGVARLRAAVARFSSGEPHARRRALVLADLERLDPAALRVAAAGGFEPDVRLRVVRVLAAALGLADPEALARDIVTVARSYFADAPDDPEADAAVGRLLPAMSGTVCGPEGACDPERPHDPVGADGGEAVCGADEETAANRIGLLVQACDATAALVERVRRNGGGPVGALREDPRLREDPPVRVMRRLAARATEVGGAAVPAGTHVVLDVAAAQAQAPEGVLLTFGAPPRICPGRAHALAIAEGIVFGASDPADPELVGADSASPEAAAGQGLGKAELAALVPETVDRVLALAATWTAWDGQPIVNEDGRTYAPHKAVRRVTDHLVDHLAELDARLAGEPTEPDHWHASGVTTPADLAPFTAADLDEARSRLTRLAGIWSRRVAALPDATLDDSPGTGWSFRRIVCHVAGSGYYADSVGDLGRSAVAVAEAVETAEAVGRV
ncbi:hypothetical protein [Kitasatospora sp. NPDC096140]|uniref:hypothetical protein n=1 Tax=Kitasatospora sp. NPDC096140 TaxID=3155425 RepID=UPI00332144C4